MKIVRIGYNGRQDSMTMAMVPDSNRKLHTKFIRQEHESVSEEHSGIYLYHFTPAEPIYPKKPALKVAQGCMIFWRLKIALFPCLS